MDARTELIRLLGDALQGATVLGLSKTKAIIERAMNAALKGE